MRYFFVLIMCVLCLGCQTTKESLPKDFTKEDLKRAADAFSMKGSAIKYCPVDGKHFSSRVEMCPQHNVKLIPVE